MPDGSRDVWQLDTAGEGGMAKPTYDKVFLKTCTRKDSGPGYEPGDEQTWDLHKALQIGMAAIM